MNERIEQCKQEIARLKQEIAIHEGAIAHRQARIAELEAAIPKPRYGDVVENACQPDRPRRLILKDGEGRFVAYNQDGDLMHGGHFNADAVAEWYASGKYVVVGNVFNKEEE